MSERGTHSSVIVAVHDAAVHLLLEYLAGRDTMIPGLAQVAGLSVVAVRRILVERRRGSCASISALCSAAGIPREKVWLTAGVTPYKPKPVFRGLGTTDIRYIYRDLKPKHQPLPVRNLLWS